MKLSAFVSAKNSTNKIVLEHMLHEIVYANKWIFVIHQLQSQDVL